MTSMPHKPYRAHRFKPRAALRLCFGGALASVTVAAWAQEATPSAPASSATEAAVKELPPIIVIGTTPLVGVGTPLERVPANVQTVRGRDIEKQHPVTLAGYFAANLPGVNITDAQGNPSQADISYRGFTASPLLGTPQGLSVFLDGVRINEPFGDVVNWDLIPQAAINTIQLIPGSNPSFGLNTLGGAIAITTKNGNMNPGGNAEVSFGSFGRKIAQIEQGGAIGSNLDYYFTANVTNDNGWADHNSSQLRQAFGKLRYHDSDNTISLSMGGADNTLNGSQTIPKSFLFNRSQAYTYPDTNKNSVGYLTLSGEHYFTPNVELTGNLYYRHYRNTNTSSNVNNNFGSVDDQGNIDTIQATNDQSVIITDSYGGSLQLTLLNRLAGMDNQFVLGAAADFANSHFTQQSQNAFFTDSRATIGIGGFQPRTDAKTRNQTFGVYFENTLTFTEQWSMTLAGRYNWSKAVIGDESGIQPLLDGSHTFSRFNPAVGINWNPTSYFTAYATYNEGMRSPTAIELACADPAAPCSLPNNFVADPDLKPVVSKTFEIGARGHIGSATTWSAAIYSTTLNDDIQFVSSNGAASTLGFFQNVGKTRRQGLELAGRTQYGPVGFTASYSYVDATYRSTWTENSASNSSADANGNITVKSGDKIPGIPANTVKLRIDYSPFAKWNIGTNLSYRGSIFARGDENNQDVNGKIPGYFLIDLDTTYNVTKQLQIFGSIKNLLDKKYSTFGIVGENFFNGPNHTFDGANPVNEQFLGLGAPRGFWVGMRYAWK
ncbi:TonB-dependent receptor [Paraburkholderia sp. GAS334]|uniref:TonB-dependent receptor n=1 Tax=Paraburkholderia sp. GAS334 TaxID=3035131 RepID=UPI003D1A34A8